MLEVFFRSLSQVSKFFFNYDETVFWTFLAIDGLLEQLQPPIGVL